MVVLPAGTFSMGSLSTEVNRDSDEGPVCTVTISRRIAMGRYEVTFGEGIIKRGTDTCIRVRGQTKLKNILFSSRHSGERMGRMFDDLNPAGQQIEIIVLTCREQLFEGIGGKVSAFAGN